MIMNFLKTGILPQITIVIVMKVVVKLAKIAVIITADIGKTQNKNHSHQNDGNGKKN